MVGGDYSSSDDEDAVGGPGGGPKPTPGAKPAAPAAQPKSTARVADLTAKRRAEAKAKRKQLLGSDDEDSAAEERASKRRNKATNPPATSAAARLPKSSSAALSFLPPPIKSGGGGATSFNFLPATSAMNKASSSSAPALAKTTTTTETDNINTKQMSRGVPAVAPEVLDDGYEINKEGVGENAAAPGAFTTDDVDYSEYETKTSLMRQVGVNEKPHDDDAFDLAHHASTSSTGFAAPPQQEDPREASRAAFLEQYGAEAVANLSKQELRELEEAHEQNKMRSVGGEHTYNEKWLEENPSYVAGLLEKKEVEGVERNLVGYQVAAGDTTQVTSTQKRKHQITFLAAKARSAQGEVSAAIASGHGIRAEASKKYGW